MLLPAKLKKKKLNKNKIGLELATAGVSGHVRFITKSFMYVLKISTIQSFRQV